ncbi:hypothetical protein HYZ05_02105 [Candidatus Daviesbacteria bacterium]|nr:hypothetical protein [Candidatus Daviesbacteria bacterium]
MAQDNKQSLPSGNGKGSLAAGVAGAVIGAAAAAAAIALSDEKNRKKAEKVLNDMQKEGNKMLKEITRMALELRDRGTKALPKGKKTKKAKKL